MPQGSSHRLEFTNQTENEEREMLQVLRVGGGLDLSTQEKPTYVATYSERVQCKHVAIRAI